MKSFYGNIKLKKSSIGLLVLALTIGGISAKAAEDSSGSSEGYLFCVKHNTNEVAYPATVSCPKGYTKLVVPTTQYAVGYVLVSRGGGTPSVWGSYSSSLGSPFGNTASGTFRFTCRENQAPCAVSLAAQSTVAGVTVWPRVMIYKSSLNNGQIYGQCEYGDGSTSASPFGAVGTITPTPLSVNIGGSLDCGAGASQSYVSPGDVSSILVPAGYYDVQSNFTFKG